MPINYKGHQTLKQCDICLESVAEVVAISADDEACHPCAMKWGQDQDFTEQAAPPELCHGCHHMVDPSIMETVGSVKMCGECAEQAEQPRTEPLTDEGCWCQCGCEVAMECDPCRMGDHVHTTRAQYSEMMSGMDEDELDRFMDID